MLRAMLAITPAPRLLAALAVLVALGMLSGLGSFWPKLWLAAATMLAIALLVDWLGVFRQRAPEVEREIPGSLSLGVRSRVGLRLSSTSRYPVTAMLHDLHPVAFEAENMPVLAELPPGVSRLEYHVRATHRGDAEFGGLHCLLRSPLGLWWRKTLIGEPSKVRVYPNFSAVSRYALLAMEDRLSEIGVRKRRRRGDGSEFQQLREYRAGDALRQIDWKATARTRKLISREYQDERDQSVIFLLDCGRRMRAQDEALAHFDEALNAVLLLAYVALRKGDAVGVGTFAGEDRWFAPAKGHAAINRMLNQLYDVEPGLTTPDYAGAAVKLLARHHKHAMVIIVTNLRDEDADDMRSAVALLSKRHRVLVASMRERAVDEAMHAPVTGLSSALRVAASYHYTDARAQYLDMLRNSGVGCLDVLPSELSVELVNLYLAIKARGGI